MLDTIIEVDHDTYKERIIVNSSNVNEVRNLTKDLTWKCVQDGDYVFVETDRAYNWIILSNKIDNIQSKLNENDLDEDESYRGLNNTIDFLTKDLNSIYLRKIDKKTINDYYTCDVV